jgi:hypothetical protein
MPAPTSYTSISRQRIGLQYLKDILDWIYTTHPSREACALSFWALFAGVTKVQARTVVKGDMEQLVADTADWNFPNLQARLRSTLEGLLSQLDAGEKLFLPQTHLTLATWADGRGHRLLMCRPLLPKKATRDDWMTFSLYELVIDLQGVGFDALGHCPQCHRYFVRQRAGRGLYCSARCRYNAFDARRRRGAKQRPRASRHRGAEKVKR